MRSLMRRQIISVPKGTTKDVAARLNSAVLTALSDPAVRKRMAEHGHEIPPREQLTPEALAAHHRAGVEQVVAHHQGGKYQGGVS